MNKIDQTLIAAITELDNEIRRLTNIKLALQGKTPIPTPTQSVEAPRRKYKRKKYAINLDETVQLIFDDNPDTIMDTKTLVKEVKRYIPNVNPASVASTVSILCRKGYVERPSTGRYIKRTK